jgi:hypothetical protein
MDEGVKNPNGRFLGRREHVGLEFSLGGDEMSQRLAEFLIAAERKGQCAIKIERSRGQLYVGGNFGD